MKHSAFKTAFFFILGTFFASCAPTAPVATDTTTLEAAPGTATLTRADSIAPQSLYLSCGCPFPAYPFSITGYGDTSVIKFSLNEPLTKDTTIHTVYAKITPSKLSSGTSSSWIAFYYLHNGQYPLYDTIRVSANY